MDTAQFAGAICIICILALYRENKEQQKIINNLRMILDVAQQQIEQVISQVDKLAEKEKVHESNEN